jgi:hypothetical protein
MEFEILFLLNSRILIVQYSKRIALVLFVGLLETVLVLVFQRITRSKLLLDDISNSKVKRLKTSVQQEHPRRTKLRKNQM